MRYADWLRDSNYAKSFRDAFELADKVDLEHNLRARVIETIYVVSKTAFDQCKKDLEDNNVVESGSQI